MLQSGHTIFRLAGQAAIVGAIAAALALAGCGRKGGLDPPPGTTAQPPAVQGGAGDAQPQNQATDTDGRPLAPRGQQKKLPIDRLID